MGLTKLKSKNTPVYFGHPLSFWRGRHRNEMETKYHAEDSDRLFDIVGYDSLHLEKREKLRQLLEAEEEELAQELERKQCRDSFDVKKDRDSKIKEREEELEKIKVMEIQKALERQKIANGIKWTREDEMKLRHSQQMQVLERQLMEEQNQVVDRMWHDVLVRDVRQKEIKEQIDARKRQQDMAERRKTYDEQIASANRRRNELMQAERDKENRRLEKMKKKMEQDHAEAIQKKKEQQMQNKMNYIEGHVSRMQRLQQERQKEKAIDEHNIRVALEELRDERIRQRIQMQRLQQEKKVFVTNVSKEHRNKLEMEEEADRVAQEWKREDERRADEFARSVELERKSAKEKANHEYRMHLEERKMTLERERRERAQQMERVRKTATNELKKKLSDAQEELRRQTEYRNNLTRQISDNMKAMETEKNQIDSRLEPFTKRPIMFKQAVEAHVDKSPGRLSTNPVHPFKGMIEAQQISCLPSLRGHTHK
ncbi:unnamed protein product [Plutella xylostella]|uniref:(diamondback moth) hypothetical protein n=1 Tax=Plutella xylostella TaxID=51655 RepID=A0A8S4G7Z6_PLUXY|nr:unnamed protein product [Plutella xylostella]